MELLDRKTMSEKRKDDIVGVTGGNDKERKKKRIII